MYYTTDLKKVYQMRRGIWQTLWQYGNDVALGNLKSSLMEKAYNLRANLHAYNHKQFKELVDRLTLDLIDEYKRQETEKIELLDLLGIADKDKSSELTLKEMNDLLMSFYTKNNIQDIEEKPKQSMLRRITRLFHS